MGKKKHKKLTIKKKIFFSLIVIILFLLVIELLSYTALSYLCVPIPINIGGDAYMTPDPDLGWTFAPGASHHIVNDRKGYDHTVRTGNGFRKDSQDIRNVRECDIITIGDSHTFGFALKEDQTLAFQLHSVLSDDEHKCLVFNGGVPGYGLDQYYLRLRSLGSLKKDSLVIVYVNPINDIANLSRDIDYSSTRPYARLAEDGVQYIKPILYDPETSFHFSPDFDSLNQAFNVSSPTPPPANIPIFQKSQTYRLFSGLRDKRFRFRWSQLEPTEEIYSYLEGWENEQRSNTNVQINPLRYAASKWMEISEFDSERHIAEEMIFGILSNIKKHVERQRAHLLIIIADEAYGNQGFIIRYEEILKQQLPQYTFEEGWSRQAIRRAAEKANIDFLMIEYPADRIDSMFISYDGHTSADGFSFVVQKIIGWIDKQQFAFLGGKTFSDVFVQEDNNINSLDGNGYTRLHYAVQNGNYQAVEQLISEGADIKIKDRWGETALFIAAARDHKSILEMLIDIGADINTADHRDQSALHQAVSNGHKDIVELLIANNVDVNAKNENGQTPLDIINQPRLPVLLRNQNNTEIREILLANGAEIMSIHSAVQLGDIEKVKEFLEKGTDINSKDGNGETPLIIAVTNNYNDIAEFLIDQGADIDTTGQYNYTPLYVAIMNSIMNNNKDMVNLLVSKGADVNTRVEVGNRSILRFAIMLEDLDIISLLLENGAKLDIEDENGWTDLHYAVQDASKDIIEFFIPKIVDTSNLYMAAFTGDLNRIQELIDRGIEVDAKDEAGWTALFWAASAGQRDVAEFLIDNGADVNVKISTPVVGIGLRGGLRGMGSSSENGLTPLHQASEIGEPGLAELLISKGADVNAKNRMGQIPLHLACRSGEKEVVELLINSGAEINATNLMGRTPLDLAQQAGNEEIIKLLSEYGAEPGKGVGGARGARGVGVGMRRGGAGAAEE